MRVKHQLIVVHGLKHDRARATGRKDPDTMPVMDGPYTTAFGPLPAGVSWVDFLKGHGWTLWKPGWFRKVVNGVELYATSSEVPGILPLEAFPLLVGGES